MHSYHSIFDSIFAPIMLLCAGQGLMSIILLLRNGNKEFSNYFLALWCLIWGTSCYFFWGYIMGPKYLNTYVASIMGPAIPISLFPPLYLYVKYFFNRRSRIQIIDIMHFLPLILYFLFTFLFLMYEGSVDSMRHTKLYNIRSLAVSYIATLQGIIYFYIVAKKIHQQNKKLKQEFSNTEKIRLQWLSHLNVLTLPVVFVGTYSTIIKSTTLDPYLLFMLYHLFMGIALYYISFHIILLPNIFSGNFPAPTLLNSEPINSEPTSSEHKNNTPFPENSEIINNLTLLMENEKLYINQDLCLQDISDKLNISRNQLSHVLNHNIKSSFYDYIHNLRLEECKKRLLDPKYSHYSILAIAFDSGFNSKTVFYRYFKEKEKMTPSDFRSKFSTKDI